MELNIHAEVNCNSDFEFIVARVDTKISLR
jgi:hypothetical protein